MLAACGGPGDLRSHADRLAAGGGLTKTVMRGEAFTLVTYSRMTRGQTLTIYIEGDGQAYWVNRFTPSPDPTPSHPMGLILALRDTALNLAYIGRPCQYVEDDRNCKSSNFVHWTTGRFAPAAVESINQAITFLKSRSGAESVALIGYSGGGAIATLVAARRRDVVGLTTIASPLDHVAWTQALGVAPLASSLNPADFARALNHIPQRHFQGADDRVVPAATTRRYLDGVGRCAATHQIKGADHETGWDTQWPALLLRPFGC